MTFAEKTSAARVRIAAPKAGRYGLVCGILSAALVLPLFSGSAAADQSGPLRGQADQLTAKIVAGGRRIRQLTVQFDRASDASAGTAAELSAARAQLQRTQQQIDASRAVLQRQAIVAYVHGDASDPAGSTANKAGLDVMLRQEYMRVASGNVRGTLDQFRLGLRQLVAQQARLRQAGDAAQRAVAGLAAARDAALAEATRDQASLDQVNGRLLQLAQAAARSAVLARLTAAPAPPARQGLPVNGGLVAVVKATVAPPAPKPPAPPPPAPPGGAGGPWLALRQCESGNNYAANTGNGYYGAYQFSQATWSGLGYPGRPDLEPPAMQDAAAQRLQAQGGWGQWPACAAAIGLT